MCLLIWTVFSGERCGPWASCLINCRVRRVCNCGRYHAHTKIRSETVIGIFHVIITISFYNSLFCIAQLFKENLFRWEIFIWKMKMGSFYGVCHIAKESMLIGFNSITNLSFGKKITLHLRKQYTEINWY